METYSVGALLSFGAFIQTRKKVNPTNKSGRKVLWVSIKTDMHSWEHSHFQKRTKGEGKYVPQCACLSYFYFTFLISMHRSVSFNIFFSLFSFLRVLSCIFTLIFYSSAEHNPSSFLYLHGWVEARVKQGFVFNDVADSRHDGLV